MEVRESAAAFRRNEGLILLRLDCAEIVLRGRINCARLRVVDSEIQSETIPDLEWIAAEDVEAGALLLEVEPILQPETLRQLARVEAEQFASLIIGIAGIE